MCGLDLTKYKEVVMTITTRPRLDGYPLCKTCARADLAQMEREMKAWESSLA
jgi:hypothetical protein